MNKTTKNTLIEISESIRICKNLIKQNQRIKKDHSISYKAYMELVRQYNYYLYVRQLEKFYSSYKYRLKRLRYSNVKKS